MRSYTPEQLVVRKEYNREYQRQWRAANPEEVKIRRKANYERNKEKVLQRGKEYYRNNIEKYKIRNKKWNDSNPDKRRAYHLAQYGITIEDYDKMFKEQNGICYTCHKPESKLKNGKPLNLSVDHNHKTGKVRKLLCYSCNLTIGKVQENIETLKNFIKYLEEN